MIRTFADKDTQSLYTEGHSKRFSEIECVALRKLDVINAAINLDTLRILPTNYLEALKGDRRGQYSILISVWSTTQ